ncbi:MAG: histidine kinase dimerization/phospho-acceptor domain-containing protein, partial [Thermoanaerobaculia bacterium]|nr:histidine kinase dimerization/phospho-acceptor domain-containing protein [Thermoanaerobaculia bacterium]
MNDERPPRPRSAAGDSTGESAERALAGGRLGQLIDRLDVGMLLLDAERRIEVVNRQASRILDLPVEAEAGWRELVERLGEPLDALEAGEARELRVDLHWRGDGEPRWVTCELFSLEEAATIDGGDPCGFAVLIRDRSALRALEADLAIAAHLRNLSRLYVGLAHDLRSPMNALVLNLELLRRALGEDAHSEAERREETEEILGTLELELARLGEALDGLLAQTLVPRQERSGSHLLLDYLIREAGLDPARLEPIAPPARSEADVALAIA